MAELERTLVQHLSQTRFEDLPDASIEAARRCVLDAIAVCVAGSTGHDIQKLLEWLEAQGGPGEASVLVYGTRLPARHASWINGSMSRAHEFDDSHDATGDHTSVPIFSAALAAAELRRSVSGREFLTAYVLAAAAGWLLGLRDDGLYAALGWRPHKRRGRCSCNRVARPPCMCITAWPSPRACRAPCWPSRGCRGWSTF